MRHRHIVRGFADPLAGTLRLELMLRGVRKYKPQSGLVRLPITPLILHNIRGVLDQQRYDYTHIMLWAACCLGYFAFLRLGEFTVASAASFDPTWHMTLQDIAIDSHSSPSLMQFTVKASKTDQLWQGICLYVGRTMQGCPMPSGSHDGFPFDTRGHSWAFICIC